jgi:hypothetical protein
MPAPSTVVTLVDDDGDEFPVRLPGVYQTNRAADAEAALWLAKEHVAAGHFTPRGDLIVGRIEYLNA